MLQGTCLCADHSCLCVLPLPLHNSINFTAAQGCSSQPSIAHHYAPLLFQYSVFHHCCSITAAPAFSVPPVFSVPVLLTIVHHCCSPLIKGPSIIQELCVHTLQLWLWIVATIVLGLDEYRDIIMAISLGSAAFVMFAPLFTAWCPQHYKDQASACFLI